MKLLQAGQDTSKEESPPPCFQGERRKQGQLSSERAGDSKGSTSEESMVSGPEAVEDVEECGGGGAQWGWGGGDAEGGRGGTGRRRRCPGTQEAICRQNQVPQLPILFCHTTPLSFWVALSKCQHSLEPPLGLQSGSRPLSRNRVLWLGGWACEALRRSAAEA